MKPEQHQTPPAARPGKAKNDSPKFGRLLIVLILAVFIITVVTFVSQAWYS